MDEHHVGVLREDLVKHLPDELMVVEVEASAEGDFRPCRHHDLGANPTPSGEKIVAIGGEVPVVDHRPGAWRQAEPECRS